ncbi:unnamed protein product [Meloidogyne enterolobii]|uniref:Uncharacterized protein n=1 Tax=Meloidogyne enterolobii TaxID=390850 RepID=A0ACB1APJ1_MELEN
MDMAREIINSYKKDNKLKNLILVESAIQHEYERNEDGRGYLLNFMKTNKLEQLKAFPDSILAYNNFLSVVTYIYFNKLGVEEMNKMLASPKEEQEEEVKDEKVNDEKKKGKKEDVKVKGKEVVKDEKKMDVEKDNKNENKEGVKDAKKEDVKLKGKEVVNDEKEEEKKDVVKHEEKKEGKEKKKDEVKKEKE